MSSSSSPATFERLDDVLSMFFGEIRHAGRERSNQAPDAVGRLRSGGVAGVQKGLERHAHDVGVLSAELARGATQRATELSREPNGDLFLRAGLPSTSACIVVHCTHLTRPLHLRLGPESGENGIARAALGESLARRAIVVAFGLHRIPLV